MEKYKPHKLSKKVRVAGLLLALGTSVSVATYEGFNAAENAGKAVVLNEFDKLAAKDHIQIIEPITDTVGSEVELAALEAAVAAGSLVLSYFSGKKLWSAADEYLEARGDRKVLAAYEAEFSEPSI